MRRLMTGWSRHREAAPKSCPFCGGAGIIERSDSLRLFSVRCGKCRAHSPFREFAAEAIAAWNCRGGEEGGAR